jgi:hypothetical protein
MAKMRGRTGIVVGVWVSTCSVLGAGEDSVFVRVCYAELYRRHFVEEWRVEHAIGTRPALYISSGVGAAESPQ